MDGTTAFIVENTSSSPVELLAEALHRSGFWNIIARARSQFRTNDREFHVLIKPDLGAFDVDSPTATAPSIVEALIDLLHENGYPRVDVCSAPDSSFLWAENRDVTVLADLLGYGYVTPGGHEYSILDLSENLIAADFPPGGVLHGSQLAQDWLDAGFRICFARNKTDEGDGYALCLDSLVGVLPLVDKDYYYRQRVAAGDAVADLLHATPLHFALIDATVSAHGQGGSRAPKGLATHCLIACESAMLIDYVGALKMGLDPYRSRLAAKVFNAIGLPADHQVDGSLSRYPGWQNVHPLITDSHRQRESSPTLGRLLKPWLQTINAEIFPLQNPIDTRVNSRLGPYFADIDNDPAAFWSLVTANYALGSIHQAIETYRILYDKDAMRQVHVPLGIRLEEYSEAGYLSIVPELSALEVLLKDTEPAAEGLRWRYVEDATLFEFSREIAVDFDEFIDHVDVARTIQYMNDYIGGVVVPVKRDSSGRVLLQAERNLYLPQPNYLALYQGKPIDVSKIEVCEYSAMQHRMFWKTVKSENQSAIYDDGVVTFTRRGDSTHIQIVGRQLFVLPPVWQAVNLDLVPDFKATLVTQAYKTFFDRTCANLEALVEGREIKIGRPWRTPTSAADSEPLPVEAIQHFLTSLGEKMQAVLNANASSHAAADAAHSPVRVDEDGFRHFPPAGDPARAVSNSGLSDGNPAIQRLLENITAFYSGLISAIARDQANIFLPSVRIQS